MAGFHNLSAEVIRLASLLADIKSNPIFSKGEAQLPSEQTKSALINISKLFGHKIILLGMLFFVSYDSENKYFPANQGDNQLLIITTTSWSLHERNIFQLENNIAFLLPWY